MKLTILVPKINYCSKIVDKHQKNVKGWHKKIESVGLEETNNFFTPDHLSYGHK